MTLIAMLSSAHTARTLCGIFLMAAASSGCSKHEESKETLLSRASGYLASAQYDKAEKEYREVLRLTPDDPVALRQLAIIYFEQNQLPQLYQAVEKAAEAQPDDADLQLKLGQTLLATGQVQQAREAALRSLEKQPGGEEALMLLASSAAGLNDLDETRQLLEEMRAKDQDRSGYHLALGILALAQKDQARAETEFNTALKVDPKSARGLYDFGEFLLEP